MPTKKSLKINFDGISLDGKKFKDWKKESQEAFFEGFQTNTLSSNNNKAVYVAGKSTSSNDFDNKNGHWITTKNGNHVFIEDEKGEKRNSSSKESVKDNKNNETFKKDKNETAKTSSETKNIDNYSKKESSDKSNNDKSRFSNKKSSDFPSKSARSKDAKPIAGVMRGKPMTFEEAGGKNVNPNYNDSDTEEDGYNYNCQSCVAVFEARMRGYNIETKPFDENNERMKDLRLHPNNAFYNLETGKEPEIKH